MTERNQLITAIQNIQSHQFDDVALQVFRYQAIHNPLYAHFLALLRINPQEITTISQIPYLPIQLFKRYQIQTGTWIPQTIFTSSGTTGQIPSRHLVRDSKWYLQNTVVGFEHFYNKTTDYCWLALLPSYLERKGSSLVDMAQHFITQSKYTQSGFFLNDFEKLLHILRQNKAQQIPTVLLGVSFGLLDLAEITQDLDFKDLIVMETGGMKGRRKELIRTELHDILSHAFGVTNIHSEYGMTELFSQAYSKGNGIFRTTPTLKILIREMNDPFNILSPKQTGAINIIDLANLDSCAFIATDDIGKTHTDGAFEVLGRMDSSDIRGCNLMVI